jgi:hypothetical protein
MCPDLRRVSVSTNRARSHASIIAPVLQYPYRRITPARRSSATTASKLLRGNGFLDPVNLPDVMSYFPRRARFWLLRQARIKSLKWRLASSGGGGAVAGSASGIGWM